MILLFSGLGAIAFLVLVVVLCVVIELVIRKRHRATEERWQHERDEHHPWP